MSAFNAGTHLDNFYFKGLNVDGVGGISAAAAVIFVLTIIFEVLKVVNRNAVWTRRDESTLGLRLCFSCVTTVSFCLNLCLAYSLMLAAMTFNVWLYLAILAGAGVGYYISAPLQKFTILEARPSHQNPLLSGDAAGEEVVNDADNEIVVI